MMFHKVLNRANQQAIIVSFCQMNQPTGVTHINSYGYLLFNNLAVWNLHEIIMSLLCKFLDAGFTG